MKAFIIKRYGSNDTVRLDEMREPVLRDDDVLVQIHAASGNPLDLKIRSGELKLVLPYRLPLILGNDLAGVVVEVCPRVRRFKPGDEVYARPGQDRIGAFHVGCARDRRLCAKRTGQAPWLFAALRQRAH